MILNVVLKRINSPANCQLLPLTLYLLLSAQTAYCSLLGDSDQLSLPSTGPNIDFNKTKNLIVSYGADIHLFEAPIKFPRVQDIAIADNSANAKYLRDLAINYVGLKKLSIIQTRFVDDQQLRLLKHFGRLSGINLDCPIENVESLSSSLPESLNEVLISPNSNITTSGASLRLAHARKIDFVGVELNHKFIQKLDCPDLLELRCLNCSIAESSFGTFASLPSLKRVVVDHTKLSISDIRNLKEHKIRLSGNPYINQPESVLPTASPHLREVPSESGSTYTLKY